MISYLDVIMDIGEQMLISGAEVHRVEDSVMRMCTSLGAVRTDVFIITSNMIVTVTDTEGNLHTQTKRITASGTNIDRIHKLNALSRRICNEHPTKEVIREEFSRIVNEKTYPFWLEIVACCFIAGSFTLFFGGGIIEALISFLIGGAVKLVLLGMDRVGINKIFEKFVCTFIASAAATLFFKLGIVPGIDKVMIGNIMSLIPGIGLTNAIRDLFIGDSIAGTLRTIEALLAALAIAAGYFLFVSIGGVI